MGSLNLGNDNIIDLEEYKKQRKEDREEFYRNLSTPTIKAFEPDHYYINPEKGTMIHVLFITDKSDIFKNYMIYVMEDPTGAFYCTRVEETTCEGWHELHADVFRHEVEKHRAKPDPPKAS